MPDAAYEIVDAPWGPIHVAATPTAVVALSHLVPTEAFVASVERRFGKVEPAGGGRDGRLARAAAEQVEEYLAGRRRTFDLPLELGARAGWDVAVLGGVSAVPWGEATSYGRVARRIGRPGAARAVGGAVGRNPIGIVIPCHRVLAGDGTLGGYGGDWWGSREALLEVKRELLRLEGIELPVTRLFD
ncbi:MAG: methylated-DNA--[protein]-cysteine S-methyltransferase [Chloroflexota bacterium]|nr:methylated-DNA--[protein]-cysteine S-methyltransferase [Chloroflexota bacterium]